jgi:hypothetical protein
MPIDMVVRLDGRWVQLPVEDHQDSGEWAAAAVTEGLAARSQDPTPAVVALYTQAWAAVLDNLRDRADDGDSLLVTAYGLVPGDEMLPVTIVELHTTALDDTRGVDGFVEDLVAPEEMRFGPPDVSEVTSPAGDAARLRQLLVVSDQNGGQTVATSLTYVWVGPEEGTAVLMAAYFASPMDAELNTALVDEVASSLTYTPVL